MANQGLTCHARNVWLKGHPGDSSRWTSRKKDKRAVTFMQRVRIQGSSPDRFQLAEIAVFPVSFRARLRASESAAQPLSSSARATDMLRG